MSFKKYSGDEGIRRGHKWISICDGVCFSFIVDVVLVGLSKFVNGVKMGREYMTVIIFLDSE